VPVDPCEFVREAVERATLADHFVISPARVRSLAKQRGLDPQDLLPEFVREAQKLAIPPTSKFHVGAAALGASGAVYLGVNIELPGLPLNASIHAEQFAVITALRAGETSLEAIATTAAPCGHCRQFMNELRRAESLRVIIPDPFFKTRHLVLPLCDLLPHAFGPLDLTHDDSLPLLLEKRHNALTLAGGVSADDAALERALAEANSAYAPYSSSPAGLVLADANGELHSGRSVESAAYNPTMSPLHVALVAAVGSAGLGDKNGGGWDSIVSATLVEIADAPVQYAGTVALILKTIAPRAALRVVACVHAD
jgi:cytidine deaminase